MNYLILLSALALSGVAAWYAIAGLIAIFAALPIPIMIMGGLLEVSKLIVASWLYRNWREIPMFMKTYFTTALIVLMMLTSMGIFGFLSKAHLDQTLDTGGNTLQIEIIDSKIAREQKRIDDANKVLFQLDEAVNVLIDYDRIRGKDGAIAVRESQKEERTELTQIVDSASDNIAELRQEKLVLDREQLALEAEVGPIRYIAALIYGDQLDSSLLEEAVRIVILMIVFVFDPLAVLMVIAANWGFKRKEEFDFNAYEKSRAEKIVRNMSVMSEAETTTQTPRAETTSEEIQDEVGIQDEVTVQHLEETEEEKTARRKAGRLLAEKDSQKESRSKAFLDKVKSQSSTSVGDMDDNLPFQITDSDK